MNLASLPRLVLLFLVVAFTSTDADAQLRHTITEEGLQISDGATPVLFYQRTATSQNGKYERANYIHPLCDLDGNTITEDFPSDHLHHRGIFWAWHQVWVDDQLIGDPWVCRDFVWEVKCMKARTCESDSKIMLKVDWKSPKLRNESGDMTTIATECVSVVVHALSGNHRMIDFDIAINAKLPDVRIGGSDNVKGYGGFSPRIRLNDKMVFESSSGVVEPIKTAIEAGRWINIRDDAFGMTIIQHKSNPKPNTQWILRRSRSMQNPVYPGRKPVKLSLNKEKRLKYRLVIHRGDLSSDEIKSITADYDK